jgi:hypothetical protein
LRRKGRRIRLLHQLTRGLPDSSWLLSLLLLVHHLQLLFLEAVTTLVAMLLAGSRSVFDSRYDKINSLLYSEGGMDAALGQDVPGSQRSDDDALMLMILLQTHHIWLPRGAT